MKNQQINLSKTITGLTRSFNANTEHSSAAKSHRPENSDNNGFYNGREISIERYLAIPTFIRQSKIITLSVIQNAERTVHSDR
ncbi:MAG: hypothetical protein KKB30_00920 [Proteobacteria bacterium]|nr:hypothetical protein [Pseudomonadota bacterium]MBU1715374.1 hypothetical protein [Pseudomonadota bacterium]